VNPVGLTTAEEANEHPVAQPTAERVKAPDGTLACQVIVPPGNACGAVAEAMIVWPRDPDSPKAPACLECAGRMRELAKSFGSNVKLESLT
jgi:hypothetical protein